MDQTEKLVSSQNHRERRSNHNLSTTTVKTSNSRSLLFYFMIAVMLFVTTLNLLSSQSFTLDMSFLFGDSSVSSEIQSKNLFKKIQAEYSLSKYYYPISSRAKQKISYGQVRQRNSKVSAYILYKRNVPPKLSQCIMTNGLSEITNFTTESVHNFLQQPQVFKWIAFINAQDQQSKSNIQKFIDYMNTSWAYQHQEVSEVVFDADYYFVTSLVVSCDAIIYLQNNFDIDKQQARKFVNTSAIIRSDKVFGYIGYSAFMIAPNGTKQQLDDIFKMDLAVMEQEKLAQYVYIFDAALLQTVTPLNFRIYNKYTLEEMLIYPMLALTQKSMDLVPFKFTFHTYQKKIPIFMEFELVQLNREPHSYCFINYPITPNGSHARQFASYLKSYTELLRNSSNTSLVSYFAYKYQRTNETLFQIYKSIKELKDKFPTMRVRLRIHYNNAVSSRSVYESVHTFCPTSSMAVASRTNIQFQPNLLNLINGKLNQKNHYYFSGRLKYLKYSELFTNKIQRRYIARKLITDFSQLQIFKTDFMKMVNFEALQSNHGVFYQAESSYILPLIEMAGLEVVEIPGLKFKASPRVHTTEENAQMDILNKHTRWDKMIDSTLRPIQFNSLTNPVFSKYAKQKIPRKIHQIWLKDQPFPEKLTRLQDFVKSVNKGYKYKLWTKQDINPGTFPMIYPHLARIFQFQSGSNKNFHPWVQAILSYEILYNEGGISLALKAESRKPLDPFLKYQLFFAGYYNTVGDYSTPMSVGRDVFGATRHNYHLKIVLEDMLSKNRINLELTDYEALVGGDLLRAVITDQQLYTEVGFGFNLFTYDIFQTTRGLCHINHSPCHEYKEAYIVLYNLV